MMRSHTPKVVEGERWSFDWNGVLGYLGGIILETEAALQKAADTVGPANLYIISHPGHGKNVENRKAEVRRLHESGKVTQIIPRDNIYFAIDPLGKRGKAALCRKLRITRHFDDRGDICAECTAKGMAAEQVLGYTKFSAHSSVRSHQGVLAAVNCAVDEMQRTASPDRELDCRPTRMDQQAPQHTMPPPSTEGRQKSKYPTRVNWWRAGWSAG